MAWTTPGWLFPGQLGGVLAVVELRGAVHELDNLLQMGAFAATTFLELDGETDAGVGTNHAALGREAVIVDREIQLEPGLGRQDHAGFDVTAAETDVGQVPKHRSRAALGLEFDGDPPPHAGVDTAIL